MAHVAFDLDNTLGFFEITNKLAFLWSASFLDNPEHSVVNKPLNISTSLHSQLKRARQLFAEKLLKDPAILATVIRPNVDALILPLLEAKKKGKLSAIIIYSNTGVSYSLELAKLLLEKKYDTSIFSLLADHWHPLRTADHKDHRPGHYVEPYKTIQTLQLLFKAAVNTKDTRPIPYQNILFVDDRMPKHTLHEQEPEGLTYLVPTHFVPKVTKEQKEYILFLAWMSLEEAGVLRNPEYFRSGFCTRNIPYEITKVHTIRGFPDLLQYVSQSIEHVKGSVRAWIPDTATLKVKVTRFLKNVKVNGK
jgi:hypothetical protein